MHTEDFVVDCIQNALVGITFQLYILKEIAVLDALQLKPKPLIDATYSSYLNIHIVNRTTKHDFPIIFLSNIRSIDIVNKIDKMCGAVLTNKCNMKCNIAFITESWLSSHINVFQFVVAHASRPREISLCLRQYKAHAPTIFCT